MCSDDGSFRVDHKTGIFSIISEVNDYHMIETEFEHKKLRILDMFPHQFNNYGRNWNCSYSNRGYMTEDMLFVGAVSTAEYYATPCNRTSATATELFNFFPFVFYNEASNNGYTNTFVIYNTDENRFMKTYWNLQRASHCVAPGSDYSTDYFPWDQTGTGRTLVWGGNGLDTGGHSYALMKDTDGQYFFEECSVCDLHPYFVKTAKGNFVYLFCEDFQEGWRQMELVAFLLNADGSVTKLGQMAVSPAWLADNRFLIPTDPGSLILDDQDSGTQSAEFTVGNDGMPSRKDK